jgi:hypothetical protein
MADSEDERSAMAGWIQQRTPWTISDEEWLDIEKEIDLRLEDSLRQFVEIICNSFIETEAAEVFSAEEIAAIGQVISTLEAYGHAIQKLEGMPRGRSWLNRQRAWRVPIPHPDDISNVVSGIREFNERFPPRKHTSPGPAPDPAQETFDSSLRLVFDQAKRSQPHASFERFHEAMSKRIPQKLRRPRTGQAALVRNRRRKKTASHLGSSELAEWPEPENAGAHTRKTR